MTRAQNKPASSQAKNVSAPLQPKLQRGFFIAEMKVCGKAAAAWRQKQATESSPRGSFLWLSLHPCDIGKYSGPFFHTWAAALGWLVPTMADRTAHGAPQRPHTVRQFVTR